MTGPGILATARARYGLDDSLRSSILAGVAGIVVVAIGARQFVHTGLTSGYLLAVVLAPVWVGVVRRFTLARLLLISGGLAAASGYLLSRFALQTHVVVPALRASSLSLLVGTLCAVGTLLWARTCLRDHAIGLLFGIGIVASVHLDHLPTQGNAWKFLFAVPVGIIALSVVRLAGGGRVWEFAVLLVLAGLSAALNSRSYFGTFLLAALLVLWQLRPADRRSKASVGRTVALMAGIGAALYYLAGTLLVNGYLGRNAQARSIEQITTSGSLLLGGRPELQATIALFVHDPLGFGFGVVATPNEVLVAKAGLASINYAPNNGYVDRFLFGSEVELHSIIGDLWAQCGLLGIVFVLVVVLVVVLGLARGIALRSADGLSLFLGIWTLWNVFFSPIYASAPTLTLALGLLLMHRGAAPRGPGGSQDESAASVLAVAEPGRAGE